MPSSIYQPAITDGHNPSATNPVSPDGVGQSGVRYTIPARQGRAISMQKGQEITIYNSTGNQVCDFFALIEGSPAEFLSMEHCRTALGRIYVREGDQLVTNRRRSLIEIIKDTSAGVHDILIACCDQQRYDQLGATGYHDNCADNFRMSLQAISIMPTHVPSPFNIWMNIPVTEKGNFSWEAPVSKPGDFIRLRVHANCIVVMSACPQDLTPVNGIGVEPAELEFELGTL